MPTGEVFFEGGSKVDDWDKHNGHAGGICSETNPTQNPSIPNYVPIIFDPGKGPSEACTVYRQPENQEINGQHTPRLYHHIQYPCSCRAARTASPDPRFSGEVGMSRPIVSNLSATAVFFEDTFTFDVTRKENNFIDRVVLIRPGAITHHWDNDQKYIELAFSLLGMELASPDATDTLLVEMPEDTVCSPEWYMLFAIENDGSLMEGHRVPSFAKFVRLK